MKELDHLRCILEANGLLDESCSSAIRIIDDQLNLLHSLEETLYNPDLFLVYMHTTPDGKKYIGITKSTPSSRWNEGAGYESQRKFYKAIQAFGWMNIEHRVIAAGLSEAEAKALETSLILKYKTNDAQFGYNTNLSVAQVIKPEGDTNTGVKAKKDSSDISLELINKYSIKTVNGQIYFYSNGNYIRESDHPFLAKELLLTYGIQPKKHREIFQIIEIISAAPKEDIFPKMDTPESEGPTLQAFFHIVLHKLSEVRFYSYDHLYDDYLTWASEYLSTPLSKGHLLQAVTKGIVRLHPEIEEVEDHQDKGLKMLPVYFSKNGGMTLSSRGTKIIEVWLNDTSEQIVCISMILDQALHYKGKCSKKTSNDISRILQEYGWVPGTVKRFSEYGVQKGFARS